MSTPAITVADLHKSQKKQRLLQSINFTVESGQTFGLIGLNGAGKTSLIKCMLDLWQADSGQLDVFGVTSRHKEARRQLVYLPEKFSPPDYMTGRLYLQYVIDAYAVPLHDPAVLEKSIMDLCERLDLNPQALSKNIRLFSKGMLQKLGIIGCLLSDKPLLILDEPMGGLDPKARVLFKKVIVDLKAQGKTILLCTHILTDVEQLCDQIGIMHQGQLSYVGTPAACCQQYQSESLEQAFLNCIEDIKSD